MALHGAGRQDPAMSLARRLVEFQNDVGVVQGDDCSIVGTSGDALPIETTALACLAWMKVCSVFLLPLLIGNENTCFALHVTKKTIT